MNRVQTTAPYGYCHCGCGERTPLARQTRSQYGQVRGEPLRFVHGHQLVFYGSGGRSYSTRPADPVDRFWAQVDRGGPDGCWVWMGYRRGNYGQVTFKDRKWRAHRLAYELLVGPIPEGYHIHHKCRNPVCVNPDHLEPLSEVEHGRKNRKLTQEQAEELCRAVDELCERYGVSPQTLADVGKRYSWKSPK